MMDGANFIFRTVQKEDGKPNEDVVYRQKFRRRFALSDGASTSFAGRAWAKLLCEHYGCDTDVRPDWLNAVRWRFQDKLQPDPDDWAASFAMEKGSYASFLGFALHWAYGKGIWKVEGICIGDTAIFATDLDFSPDPDGFFYDPCDFCHYDFSEPPVLLGSNPAEGAFEDNDGGFEAAKFSFDLPRDGLIFAMTDALAAWVVADGKKEAPSRLRKLHQNMRRKLQFDNFVQKERSEGRLKTDDTSLLIVRP